MVAQCFATSERGKSLPKDVKTNNKKKKGSSRVIVLHEIRDNQIKILCEQHFCLHRGYGGSEIL